MLVEEYRSHVHFGHSFQTETIQTMHDGNKKTVEEEDDVMTQVVILDSYCAVFIFHCT